MTHDTHDIWSAANEADRRLLGDDTSMTDRTDDNRDVDTIAVESESEPYRSLGNAKAVLSDIQRDQLTDRERNRLWTIQRKLQDLEKIMAERIASDVEGDQ